MTCAGSKPGFTRWSRRKLLASRPADTSRTSVSATSATTSTDRAGARAVPRSPPASLSALTASVLDACHAGSNPKRTPVASDATTLTIATVPSTPTESARGRPAGNSCTSTLISHDPASRSDRAADRAKNEALDQQLTHQVRARGAKRRSNRQLAPPAGGPRDQQARDVRARDEQDEPDRSLQQQQRAAHVADEILAQRHEDDIARAARIRMFALHVRSDRVHVVLGVVEADAVLDSPDRLEVPDVPRRRKIALVDRRRGHRLLREYPQLRPVGPSETRRHDADDGRGLAVHVHAPADRCRVRSEERVPRRLIEDHHRLGRHRILCGRERPAERRRRAQHIEERCGDVRARQLLRVARLDREGEQLVAHAGHRRQRPVVVLDVEELSRGMAGPRLVGRRRPHADDPRFVAERQRTQQHAVDHAEDGGVGGNPERNRRDRNRREGGGFQEGAESVGHSQC